MVRALLAVFLLLVASTAPALSQGGRETLGYGRLFTNDALGDGRDRWRTGSYSVSRVVGYGWSGALPEEAGEIIEYRFRADILAPESLTAPAPGDRRWAGALSAGVHTHFQRQGYEISAGLDLVFTGDQTGLDELQKWVHEALGLTVPTVLGNQIGNGIHPTATLEIGRPIAMSDRFTVRPFAEVQAGAETLVRLGGDITFGNFGQGELQLRDVSSGQRFRAVGQSDPGFSFVVGGDVAKVAHSIYLPSSDGYQLTDVRGRLRAGLHWQGKKSDVFYGLTWLGKEFEAQKEAQLIGSIRLDLKF